MKKDILDSIINKCKLHKPLTIEEFDELHSDAEDRIKVIGMVAKVLVVIYTERGEKYRLISARLANKREVDKYYGQFNY